MIFLFISKLFRSRALAGKFMAFQLHQCINGIIVKRYFSWMYSNTFMIQYNCHCLLKASVIIVFFLVYCCSFAFDLFWRIYVQSRSIERRCMKFIEHFGSRNSPPYIVFKSSWYLCKTELKFSVMILSISSPIIFSRLELVIYISRFLLASFDDINSTLLVIWTFLSLEILKFFIKAGRYDLRFSLIVKFWVSSLLQLVLLFLKVLLSFFGCNW